MGGPPHAQGAVPVRGQEQQGFEQHHTAESRAVRLPGVDSRKRAAAQRRGQNVGYLQAGGIRI